MQSGLRAGKWFFIDYLSNRQILFGKQSKSWQMLNCSAAFWAGRPMSCMYSVLMYYWFSERCLVELWNIQERGSPIRRANLYSPSRRIGVDNYWRLAQGSPLYNFIPGGNMLKIDGNKPAWWPRWFAWVWHDLEENRPYCMLNHTLLHQTPRIEPTTKHYTSKLTTRLQESNPQPKALHYKVRTFQVK
jgi:hypothetical protein